MTSKPSAESTVIPVKRKTREELKARGRKGETYDQVIQTLLHPGDDENGKEKTNPR